MVLTGEPDDSEIKTCRCATFPTTNATRTCLGLKPDLRSQRPASKSLSHGTAVHVI